RRVRGAGAPGRAHGVTGRDGARPAHSPARARRYTAEPMSLFQKLLHAGEGRKLKAVQALVPDVAAFEPDMERKSDDELRAMTDEFRRRLDRGREQNEDDEE